ncbi:MAG: TonB-dependent receptor [Cyclobacteriaceae bacterium]|nr:TonB-dependent receptor [Cyclobacteriaceae bacterium HetDA_MAG_MS6]
MKRKLLDSFIMLSKYFLYIMILQVIGLNLLMANTGKAQEVKSIKEVYLKPDMKRANSLQLLQYIESKSDFRFTYDNKDVDEQKLINVPQRETTVADLLMVIAENTSLVFKQFNENIDVKKVSRSAQKQKVVVVQGNPISGKITDEDGGALPGATVQVVGTNVGTVTDVDGNFRISAPEDATRLSVSFVGYVTREVSIEGRSQVDVSLSLDIQALNEVVVVGYGTQKKRDITGAVGSVEDYRLQNVPNTNFAQALQGSVSGVYITNNSAGAEGGNVSLRIRGQNSILANNSPLIVLDGIPFSGDISQINQNDIESIEVLKDVSSSAIYGTRGANGVILITTKKGTLGKPTITYSGYIGIQEAVNVPEVMNGEEFYDWKLERLGALDDPASVMTPTEIANHDAGISTDWLELATRTSIQQQHVVSVASATENTKYYISGTYLDVEGVAEGDDFKRYNLRLNLEQKVNEWLTTGTNTQLGYIDRGGASADFTAAFLMNPLTNPKEEDGSLTIYPWPEDPFFGNPLGNTLYVREDEEYTVFSNIYLNADIPFVPGLSYKLNTGIEYSNRDRNTYQGRNTKNGFETNGNLNQRQLRTRNFIVENIMSYKKTFGDHNLDITALYSTQTNDFTRFENSAEGFPNDVLTFYQGDLASVAVLNSNGTFRKSNLISQMGRINYSYAGKYLFTLTGRRDGFSGFGSDEKYGFFPSVALGWNIIDEPFLSNVNVLSNLKLRTSYGQIGNQAIQPYQTLARLDAKNYLTGDNGDELGAGFIPGTLATSNLGWETTTSLNLGIDYGLFEGRVQGTIDYYISNTEDLLLNRAISPIHGITSITQNVGETKNIGFEALLSAIIIDNGDFKWSADFNFSLNRNEITRLYGNGEDDIANRWFIGEPIDVNYGLVFDGIWQQSDSTNAALYGAIPGDVRIKDFNGDTLITTDDDRGFIGNRQPDFIAGLGSTLTYKNFSLNFFLHTVQGVTKANRLLDSDETIFFVGARRNGVKRTWWTPENAINTYPRNDENSNPRGVLFYEDASFIRLKDVTLSYTLPQRMLTNISLADVRFYVTARNLVTITDWTGLDPEFDNQFAIPLNRTFIFGINATIK